MRTNEGVEVEWTKQQQHEKRVERFNNTIKFLCSFFFEVLLKWFLCLWMLEVIGLRSKTKWKGFHLKSDVKIELWRNWSQYLCFMDKIKAIENIFCLFWAKPTSTGNFIVSILQKLAIFMFLTVMNDL